MIGTSPRARLVLVLATAVSAVGLLDAVVGGTWDFVVVFALALVLQLLLLLRWTGSRTELSVRQDLAEWLAEQAVATGDAPEHVLDRCVAAARHGLVAQDDR